MTHSFDSLIAAAVKVTVAFDYTPEQKEILYPNDDAQPGYPAEVDVFSVMIGDDEIIDELNKDCLDRLEKESWASLDLGDGNDY